MKIIECDQGSEQWFKARCGIPTASNFDKIVDTKGNVSKQRDRYLYQLAGERITKRTEDEYQNEAMKRGKLMEEEARKFYELKEHKNVRQVGLCLTEGKFIWGASPDGIIGKEGLLEIKCPLLSTHVSYLLKDKLPLDYWQQTQGQLLVTGYKYVDFISYYPGMRPLIIKVKRDPGFLRSLDRELVIFSLELDKIVKKVK